MIVIKRPDWWREGQPLPALQPSTTYTGKGKIRSGGKVNESADIYRRETLEEYKERKQVPLT